jgi:hypothetical protein
VVGELGCWGLFRSPNVLFCRSIEILLLTRSVGFAALLQGWFSVFALQMCCKVALAVDVFVLSFKRIPSAL